MNKDIIEYCEYNIETLEKYLDELYTIDCPEGYSKARCKNGKINVYNELEYLKELESIYGTFGSSGVGQGELYEKYNKYLQYIKKWIGVFEITLDELKKEHSNDITVAEELLKRFRQHLNINKAFDDLNKF